MQLKHPPVETEWIVVKSFLINHPPSLFSDTLPELRSRIAALAREANRHREAKKQIKGLYFKYMADDQDHVDQVEVFFDGYKQKGIRLMKLVRVPHAS